MPPHMLQWRPLHIATLLFGSIASIGWAADVPLCPSQATARLAQPADAQEQPGATSSRTPAKERKPGVNDGAIDIHSDHATVGVDGNATLKGNVSVSQGERQIHADEIQYNSKTNGFRTDSSL
jgi:lipopolysaccharide assembly outer membrane protein LptD (OstA)